MVIGNPDALNAANNAGGGVAAGGVATNLAHPSGIPQDQIDNIMSGIANTGDVKMNNHRKKLRQRFDIIKKLGQGTYGKVQLGINKETGQEVAIKTIKKCKIEAEADLVRIRREVQIMSSVHHPNIIHIYEVFENREKMVLVMEFAAGGELYDYLSERKVLTEEEARRIFRQVATAVYYCHKHKICHRDLKLENILLDEQGNAKIADFGLSNVFDDQRMLATFCGSPLYASPEIVEGTPYQGPEVDCWSLGVLLYTLVYGSMPFDGSNFKRLVKQISQGDYYEPKKPSRASTLIRDMLTVCPRKRATIEQICAHWWVNENDNMSCLDLAEDLANQTPVRLDVLLSLTPAAITADQLVVPSADSGATGKSGERVARSHSVGSIRDMATEAERRILDMVAAGGEAALMPSPTRTITPAQSPIQSKRKLETTVSTENAADGALKKKEKPSTQAIVIDESTGPLTEETPMETEDAIVEEPVTPAVLTSSAFSQKDMQMVGDLCEQLIHEKKSNDVGKVSAAPISSTPQASASSTLLRQRTAGKLDAVEEAPEEKDAAKVVKKFVTKHKTADLANVIGQATSPLTSTKTSEAPASMTMNTSTTPTAPTGSKMGGPPATAIPFVRKCSLQDDEPKLPGERRKSRILETAEKFHPPPPVPSATSAAAAAAPSSGNDAASKKPKKPAVVTGTKVGSFMKEFERKASTTAATPSGPTAGELRALEQVAAAAAAAEELENITTTTPPSTGPGTPGDSRGTVASSALESSDSKNSVNSLSLEDARRSMENSIALLRQAQTESSKEVDQLCAKTESFSVKDTSTPTTPTRVGDDPFAGVVDRERKLKNARAIIGNAIQPVICWPQPPPPLVPPLQPTPPPPSILPQPPPPSQAQPPTSVFGIGIGAGRADGYSVGCGGGLGTAYRRDQLGNGHGQGSSSGSSDSNHSFSNNHNNNNSKSFYHNNNNKNHNLKDFYSNSPTPTSLPFTSLPTSFAYANPAPSVGTTTPTKATWPTAAKAAARQTIMDRLTSSGATFAAPPQGPPALPRTQFSQSGHPLYTPIGSYQHQQQQQQQQQLSQVRLKQLQLQQKQLASHSQQPAHHYQQQQQQLKQHQHQRPLPSYTAAPHPAAANTFISGPPITANTNSVPKPFYNAPPSLATLLKSSPGGDPNAGNGSVKTSTASITLKSATLPRRKPAKVDIQLDMKPRIVEQPSMRFTTEMQHPIADLRSAPARDGPSPYSPVKTSPGARATSLEPKEHVITIQRQQPPYSRTTSNTTNRSGSLSRQSTVDSESDTTTTNMSQATMTGSSQPIKKSPREFIIPIAMEGGGFITPREGSIEPSDSSHTNASSRTTFNRLRPTRRIGSLLSETGLDEASPFQKMRTSSANRDSDDDPRFTIHRLRSTRPMKKATQDNDSQSSGEEDDDDGFEILTAENLFSTLLQRVRALTNRLNVNNDLTSGFPNSSRLLGNMRQGQAPFWNQEPFGRSHVSYSYSHTVQKKHVRLNNTGGPWRHSMSRDLGTDMDSMFSRTGATLPRGSKERNRVNRTQSAPDGEEVKTPPESAADGADDGKRATKHDEVDPILEDEPLDLADLDLSRLRLSKKDLETLSSITPGLPKCFQEQLLAKLPPTQARKLSRTLSMQNSPHVTTVKLYKRSQSGGRTTIPDCPIVHQPLHSDLKEETTSMDESAAAEDVSESPEPTQRQVATKSHIYRRTASYNRYDTDSTAGGTGELVSTPSSKSRSSSLCRDNHTKSMYSSPAYTSDASDKYRYYSPYLSKSVRESTTSTESGSVSPQKRYGSASSRESGGRPPSGCLSPPIQSSAANLDGCSASLRRLSNSTTQQRRLSRLLRPELFDEMSPEDGANSRTDRLRDRDSQSQLREILEKSCESSLDSQYGEQSQKKSSHTRNKSMDDYTDLRQEPDTAAPPTDTGKRHRRSLSRPRNFTDELDKHELADRILKELQLLSAMRSQQEGRLSVPRETSLERSFEDRLEKNSLEHSASPATTAESQPDDLLGEKTGTIRKLKKVKVKEKPKELVTTTADGDYKLASMVVKKVKKIVKKSESTTKQSSMVPDDGVTEDTSERTDDTTLKRESKLKRPTSYPTKELGSKSTVDTSTSSNSTLVSRLPTMKAAPTAIPEDLADVEALTPTTTSGVMRESRLVRPKSYPASKLTPPKESKKVTRSGAAIPSITEIGFEEKSPVSVGETTSTIKKIKVAKKSKLVQPTPLSPLSPDGVTMPYGIGERTDTPVTGSKESSPTTAQQQPTKEKSPEKKPGKGLFYTLGQKFEKLRDSAMNKEKRSSSTTAAGNGISTTASAGGDRAGSTSKKSSPDSSSPEKIKEKTTLLKKKSIKTDKSEKAAASKDIAISSKTKNGADSEKPIKSDKRSRIDAMIRSLRERSVPRSMNTTESNYIKRAVSVEEMPGTFNRTAVNRVLGLFKRFDKDGTAADGGDRRVRSTRSTSNIDSQMREGSPATTPKPLSPIYQNTGVNRTLPKKDIVALPTNPTAASAAVVVAAISTDVKAAATCSTCEAAAATATCSDCPEYDLKRERSAKATGVVLKRRDDTVKSRDSFKDSSQAAGNKDKRKGLMLDLDAIAASSVYSRINAKAAYINGHGLYSNLPPYPGAMHSSSNNSSSLPSTTDNTVSSYTTNNNNNHSSNNNNNSSNTNNNNASSIINGNSSTTTNSNNNNNNTTSSMQTSGYRTSSAHEINRNHALAPSSDNVAYSSDSRSFQDDCASTSTFMSPTEESELCFDNWSICSEDNYMLHATPSPTVSRLSRGSQRSSPTRGDSTDPNESMIDRIKRRSFYCRFNDKKPRRTSSIVGPTAVRDYYREQKTAAMAAANKVRSIPKPSSPEERAPSPDITQQFLRPLKLSPAGTECKPPVYRSPHDSSTTPRKPRRSLADIRPPISSASSSYLSKRYDTIHASNEHMDYLSMTSPPPSRYKPTSSGIHSYESNGGTTLASSGYYSTYNPKRRSSYTLNGLSSGLGGTSSLASATSAAGCSNLDGYATVGRRTMRPYDQRTRSLLDPSVISASTTSASSYLRRDSRTPVREYTPSISRSSPRYRTSSMSRSPTNI